MNPLRWPFYTQTLFAMILGIAAGVWFGPSIAFIGVLSKAIIITIKAFATPLLFFAILDSLLNAQFHGRGILWMFGLAGINGLCAIVVALTLLNTFQPGHHLIIPPSTGKVPLLSAQHVDWAQAILNQIPEGIVSPFVNNAIPAVILLALLFGGAIRSLEKQSDGSESFPGAAVTRWVRFFLHLHMRVIEWIVRLVPLAVFSAVAKAVGETGFAVVPGLALYVAVCVGGMLLQILIVYHTWIAVIAGVPLRKFWSVAKDAVAHAFGVNSSLATLPLTLKAMDGLGVSPASARLAACVGTNLNNDGILLYEVAAAIFITQAHGIALSIPGQVALAAVCIFATIGIAGVPEAGFISLALVLSTVGLPAESLPLLLTVDWLVARCRSATNVISDITCGIGIDAMSVKKVATA